MRLPPILCPPGVRLTTDATEPAPVAKAPTKLRVRWRRRWSLRAQASAFPLPWPEAALVEALRGRR